MRIFTKTIKTIGVTANEAEDLIRLSQEALRNGKSDETQIGPSTFLQVVIGEYEYMSSGCRRRMAEDMRKG